MIFLLCAKDECSYSTLTHTRRQPANSKGYLNMNLEKPNVSPLCVMHVHIKGPFIYSILTISTKIYAIVVRHTYSVQ